MYELDEKFHRRYVEAGAGPRLRSLHDAVKPQAERYTGCTSPCCSTGADGWDEHDVIVVRSAPATPLRAARRTDELAAAADRLVRAIE